MAAYSPVIGRSAPIVQILSAAGRGSLIVSGFWGAVRFCCRVSCRCGRTSSQPELIAFAEVGVVVSRSNAKAMVMRILVGFGILVTGFRLSPE